MFLTTKSGTMGLNDLLLTGLLLIVQISLSPVLVEAQHTNFSFPYFKPADQDSFILVDDVSYYADNSSFLMNLRAAGLSKPSCGRLLYKDKVRVKGNASDVVISFHTAFTFQVTGLNFWVDRTTGTFLHGDGLAFTFARNNTIVDESIGGSLCLLKSDNSGMVSNRVFAVEFDTFLNEEYSDSSDSHIGVDINSMVSIWSYNLCGGIVKNCSYLSNGGYFTAWIDYDSTLQKLEVYFANGSLFNNIPKPTNPLLEANLNSSALRLAELFDPDMYVGFTSSTGFLSEVLQIQSWTFSSSGMPDVVAVQPLAASNSSNVRKVGIIAGVSAGAAGALLVAAFVLASYLGKSPYRKQDKFNLLDQNLVPRIFTYKELRKATRNFSRSELLGSGGFGAVYKGTLPSGALVAVKRMKHENKQGEEGFLAEAASLSQIRHRNLVQLRGWCSEEEQLLLVYDYMCNGSLDEWLFKFPERKGKDSNLKEVEALPLALRHSVLSGVAAALSYLHEECVQCVLHRDIKSSNVLLDGDLNAYLGDFGLARLIDHRKMEKTTMMAGTLGYMAPEMPHTGKATKETDVYSFGVLVLEVMCGARPLDVPAIERGEGVLVDRVWRAHEAGNILEVAESRLGNFSPLDTNSGSSVGFETLHIETSRILTSGNAMDEVEHLESLYASESALEEKKLVTNLLHLGLLCCNPNPEDRPSMRLVSQLLQSSENMEMSMPPLPGRKPHAHYSRPGFSQILARISSSVSASSSVVVVQDAALALSQTTPSSTGVSFGEAADVNMQNSFAAPDSSLFSGR